MENTRIFNQSKYKTYNIVSSKISAVNNKVRFSILEILSSIEKINQLNSFNQREPLYSRELNAILLEKYDIDITPQMLGQHLKQLVQAQLINEIDIKKEIPNKVGSRTVKAYKINISAFKDLFLDIDIFRQELLSLFELYNQHNQNIGDEHCTLTILNGVDKGKTYKINKNQSVSIGRIDQCEPTDITDFIVLNDKYDKVSKVTNPHIKLSYNDDKWVIIDYDSKNGTFIDDKLVPKNKVTPLKSQCFLRLSKGTGGVVFYCTYYKK